MPYEIRVMTPADYDAVYALWQGTPGVGLRPHDDDRAGITAYLRRNPTTSFLALDGTQTVGALLAGHDGRRGYLYHATVAPQYRGQGIGTRLVDAALAALAREGIGRVALVAFADNEAGNAFWAARGFTRRDDIIYRNKML